MKEREFSKNAPRPFFLKGLEAFCLFIFSIILLTLLQSKCSAQWKALLSRSVGTDFQTPYFIDLPGPPRIGFVGSYDSIEYAATGTFEYAIYKTTDAGNSWKQAPLSTPYGAGEAEDITFKDSMTGWVAMGQLGLYKTTDQGESWNYLPGTYDYISQGVYYDKMTGGLFVSGDCSTVTGVAVSYDDGTTWAGISAAYVFIFNGFAFNNDSVGIVSANGAYSPHWIRTTDGGKTWNIIAMDSITWQPLAIPGTRTMFAITWWSGKVFRSTDAGITWDSIFAFPLSIIDEYGNIGSGCIRGDSSHLFVQNRTGCYMSTDQGMSWNYLCGQPSNNLGDGVRFYYKDGYVYLPTYDSASGIAALWMLNLDSMNNVTSNFSEQFVSGSKRETVHPGDTVLVDFLSDTALGPEVGTDPVSMSITVADTSSLSLVRFVPSAGWRFEDSSYSNGTYRFLLVCSDSLALASPNKILRGVFASYLTEDSVPSKVYLDSVHLYGHRLNCDCSVESVLSADTAAQTFASALDSVEVDFSGCADSILLEMMQGGQLTFSIVSIQPNPAQTSITVTLSGLQESGSGDREPGSGIDVEMFDVLGQSVLTQPDERGTSLQLDVLKVPPGVYFLRLSQNGYVETRSVSIER